MRRPAKAATIVFALTGCLSLAQKPEIPGAPGGDDRAPMIVLLKDGLNTNAFAGGGTSDISSNAQFAYLDRGVVGMVRSLESAFAFRSDFIYSAAIRGFAARLTAAQAQSLREHPFVQLVEEDKPMNIDAQTIPWGVARVGADASYRQAGDGTGTTPRVTVYVLDTGIDRSNSELKVINHLDFTFTGNFDCNGHGTHVAGTIGARDNTSGVVGVAPGVSMVGLKVLQCNGSGATSGVVAAVDWVTANAVKPAVANMSLTGGASPSLDNALRNSANSGVFYSVAAGNQGSDSCNFSPARVGGNTSNGVMTVGATDSSNREAYFSNHGTCIDVWAPGVDVLSTLLGGGLGYGSGTSMAAPHVAGVAALYLSRNPNASARSTESRLRTDRVLTTQRSRDNRKIWIIYGGYY